jgi:CDP-diglyceride synthetase
MIPELSPELTLIGIILSIIFALVIIGVGIYFKKKEKSWWSLPVLLGLVSIIVNGARLLL